MSMASVVLLTVLLAAAPQAAPDVDGQAKDIESALIAPCCFRQQVSVHSSPAADEVRRDVRARLEAGETRAQILDAYVAQYGKRILAEPPAEGFGAALQVAPFFMAIAGVAFLVFIVRRLTAHLAPAAAPAGDVPLSADEQAHLDDALRDLD
jgi:cytochrome c-type biogenesis protein CcmH